MTSRPSRGKFANAPSDSGGDGANRGYPALALDIGGTWCRAAVVAADGVVLASQKAPTLASRTGAEILDTCGDLVRTAARQASVAIHGLGVGSTGPVNPRTGRMYVPPNAAGGLVGLQLADGLSRVLDGVPVVVEKDTNASAIAESLYGGGRGVTDFIYATFSTGVGAAIVCDGRLLHGANGVAGELGHVCVDPAGPLCGCNRRGCLEAFSSGPALASRAIEAGYRRHAASGLTQDKIDGREISLAAQAGNNVAARVMARAGEAVVSAVVDWVNIFNPAVVVLGGSVLQGNLEWVERTAEAVKRDALEPANQDVNVMASQLGDDSVLLGAAGLLRQSSGPGLG